MDTSRPRACSPSMGWPTAGNISPSDLTTAPAHNPGRAPSPAVARPAIVPTGQPRVETSACRSGALDQAHRSVQLVPEGRGDRWPLGARQEGQGHDNDTATAGPRYRSHVFTFLAAALEQPRPNSVGSPSE